MFCFSHFFKKIIKKRKILANITNFRAQTHEFVTLHSQFELILHS